MADLPSVCPAGLHARILTDASGIHASKATDTADLVSGTFRNVAIIGEAA